MRNLWKVYQSVNNVNKCCQFKYSLGALPQNEEFMEGLSSQSIMSICSVASLSQYTNTEYRVSLK